MTNLLVKKGDFRQTSEKLLKQEMEADFCRRRVEALLDL